MNPFYLALLKLILQRLLGTVKGQHAYDTVVNIVLPAIETLDPTALAELEKLNGGKPV